MRGLFTRLRKRLRKEPPIPQCAYRRQCPYYQRLHRCERILFTYRNRAADMVDEVDKYLETTE